PGVALHVDRVLGHAGVGRPAPVRPGRGPGDHLPGPLDDDARIPVPILGELRLDLGMRAGLRLEGGDPLLDPLVVDARDDGGIRGGRQPGGEGLHHSPLAKARSFGSAATRFMYSSVMKPLVSGTLAMVPVAVRYSPSLVYH